MVTELTQAEETDSWRAQTKPCVHQDPGKRRSDPTRDRPRLPCECPGVSGRGMGQTYHGYEVLHSSALIYLSAERAQTLCAPGPRDPVEAETELCLSVSCRSTGQQWTAAGAGALGAADLGMA